MLEKEQEMLGYILPEMSTKSLGLKETDYAIPQLYGFATISAPTKCIGNDDKTVLNLPIFESPAFIKMTNNNCILIMGRTTYELYAGKLPASKAKIVLTKSENYTPKYGNTIVLSGVDETIQYLKPYVSRGVKFFVIGGEKTFVSFRDYLYKIYVLSYNIFEEGNKKLLINIDKDYKTVKHAKLQNYKNRRVFFKEMDRIVAKGGQLEAENVDELYKEKDFKTLNDVYGRG